MIRQPENARQAVAKMGLGWNLGNSMDAVDGKLAKETDVALFEQAWFNPVTPPTLMRRLKKLGFGTVRIPITWLFHFDEEGVICKEWLDRVQELVDQAMEAELYCIINIHHDTGDHGWLRASMANYEKNKRVFAALWEQIAIRFRDYPQKLLFEGFNEMLNEESEWGQPSSDEPFEAIDAYNRLFVETVCATEGENLTRNLLICTYAASLVPRCMQKLTVPKDVSEEHIIGEVHFYNPVGFAMKTKDFPDETIFTNRIEKEMDWTLESIAATMKDKNIPVIIGEFSCIDKDNEQERELWHAHMIKKSAALGIACIIWDNGKDGEMGYLDRVGEEDTHLNLVKACLSNLP